ncbi:unnamed protein product, partial [Haemonchus placei]|uniref:Leucine-rich repeat domain-containing protein n=1 Tax=Haemonchus placei TaxID=6290 RepID=A0A0N4WGS9_HAEPC
NFSAFTCNDLRQLPPAALLKAAFPDIQGIDIQGNPLFNCSSLANIREEIAILTDCDADTKPIQCDVIDKVDLDIRDLCSGFQGYFREEDERLGSGRGDLFFDSTIVAQTYACYKNKFSKTVKTLLEFD